MPKKLVKKVIKDTFETPGEIVKTAAEQVGVIPREKEKESKLTEEQLEEKRRKDEVMRKKRLAEIQAGMKQIVEERKAARVRVQQAEELKKKEKKQEKPLFEPKTKRPRGFLLGLKRRLEKSRAELAGRRVGG